MLQRSVLALFPSRSGRREGFVVKSGTAASAWCANMGWELTGLAISPGVDVDSSHDVVVHGAHSQSEFEFLANMSLDFILVVFKSRCCCACARAYSSVVSSANIQAWV